jgi:hypothetical protein
MNPPNIEGRRLLVTDASRYRDGTSNGVPTIDVLNIYGKIAPV